MKHLNKKRGFNKSTVPVRLVFFLAAAGFLFQAATFAPAQEKNAKKKNNYTLSGKQFQPVLHSRQLKVKTYKVLKQNVRFQIQQLAGGGPDGGNMYKLNEIMDIETPPEFDNSNIDQVFSLSPTVYQDVKNNSLRSKIYYYTPGKYFLSWDKSDGYLLRFYYKGQSERDGKKMIHIDFWLTPGHQPKDYQLLKKLIRAHTGYAVKELIRLPADYRLSLKLGAQEIPPEQITISGVDTDSGEIHVVVETDVFTKEMLKDQLGDLGWGADMEITPASYSDEAKPVEPFNRLINIRLCDRDAFTQEEWRRESGEYTRFTNDYDFPLELKHLYFLRENRNRRLKVYGFNLGNIKILPGQTAKIANGNIPDALDDNKTLKAWYDFRLVKDAHHLEKVLGVVTGGLGEIPIKPLNLVAVNSGFFNKYNLFEVVVQIHSYYFDPKGEKGILKKYKLSKDSLKVTGDPLYITDSAGGTDSLFKYKLTVIDGNAGRYTDPTWRRGETGEDTIYIGEKQVSELLGEPTGNTGDGTPAAGTDSSTSSPAGESQSLAITRISPESVSEGEAFRLHIYGSGFLQGAKAYIEVNINMGDKNAEPEYSFSEIDCDYIDSTHLSITFDNGFSAAPRERKIYVQNPDNSETETLSLKIL